MSLTKRPFAVVAMLACVAALALSACGSSSNSSGTKTIGVVHGVAGFALHAGAAFYLFHHFVYEPYEQGKLKLKFSDTLHITKAVAAAALAYHEAKEAKLDLEENPHLSKLVSPWDGLLIGLAALAAAIRHGHASNVSSINGSMSSISSTSSGLGTPLKDISTSL